MGKQVRKSKEEIATIDCSLVTIETAEGEFGFDTANQISVEQPKPHKSHSKYLGDRQNSFVIYRSRRFASKNCSIIHITRLFFRIVYSLLAFEPYILHVCDRSIRRYAMHTPPRRGAIIRHAQSWHDNKTLPPILPRLRVASRSCLHSGTGLGPIRARRHGELPIYRLFYTILHALTRRRAASTFPFLRTQPRQRMQLSLPSSPMSSEQLRAYLGLTALLKLFTRSQIGDLFEANRRRLARIDVVVCRAYLLQFRYALRFVVRSQKTTHRIISTALLAFAA